VAQLRAVGRDSVYAAIKGYIHARSICALRGLDLQLTAGYTSIRIGSSGDLVSAIIFYCWARTPEHHEWEQAPDEH
jgi:stage V sporulation protein SpoVS